MGIQQLHLPDSQEQGLEAPSAHSESMKISQEIGTKLMVNKTTQSLRH